MLTRSTTAAAAMLRVCFMETPIHRIDGDLLARVVHHSDEDEYLCMALASRSLAEAVRRKHPKGWRTAASFVVSSLERLQWVRGLPGDGPAWLSAMDYRTSWLIARYGRLEVLQWAGANGCEWDSRACYAATRGWHLEVLQ